MARTGGRGSREKTPDPADAVPAPRANPLLLGQEGAEATVLGSWGRGRMSHAWLITGPRGVGKATLAHRMARFILAHGLDSCDDGGASNGLFGEGAIPASRPTSLAMDPESPFFQRVAAGGHGDMRVVERGVADERQALKDLDAGRAPRRRTEIVVDDVRGIGAFLSLTPAEGGWRVVVIDAADEMNRNAANAVLKVLEEPPRRAVLLLVAHNPARLPPTIPSRCRRLVARPLAEPVMRDLLGRYRSDLDEDACSTLIGLSRGSIGTALTLARRGGLELYAELTGLLRDLPRLDVARLHALGDRAAQDEVAWGLLRDLLPGWLGRLARFIAIGGGTAGRPPGPSDAPVGQGAVTSAAEADIMVRLARAAPLDRWITVWEKTSHLLGRTEAVHLDRKQAILAALLLVERTAARA